jgi:hypothetical protein
LAIGPFDVLDMRVMKFYRGCKPPPKGTVAFLDYLVWFNYTILIEGKPKWEQTAAWKEIDSCLDERIKLTQSQR